MLPSSPGSMASSSVDDVVTSSQAKYGPPPIVPNPTTTLDLSESNNAEYDANSTVHVPTHVAIPAPMPAPLGNSDSTELSISSKVERRPAAQASKYLQPYQPIYNAEANILDTRTLSLTNNKPPVKRRKKVLRPKDANGVPIERPFVCPECDYAFKQNSHLIRHMDLHRDDKSFACTECDFKTRRKYSLTCHMRTHTGETPYHCDQCDHKCGQYTTLMSHIRAKHTVQQELYACAHCPKTIKAHTNLMKHLQTHCRALYPVKGRIRQHQLQVTQVKQSILQRTLKRAREDDFIAKQTNFKKLRMLTYTTNTPVQNPAEFAELVQETKQQQPHGMTKGRRQRQQQQQQPRSRHSPA